MVLSLVFGFVFFGLGCFAGAGFGAAFCCGEDWIRQSHMIVGFRFLDYELPGNYTEI